MKKLKVIVLLAVGLALVLLCANLPKLIGRYAAQQGEKMSVANGQPTVVTHPPATEADTGEKGFSVLGKLGMYLNGENVDTQPAKAVRTVSQIKACVEGFMAQCLTAGIYQGMEPAEVTVTPQMFYLADDPSRSVILWRYYATQTGPGKSEYGPEELRVLDVMVDDETGMILSASFDHYYTSFAKDDIYERNKQRAEPLTDLYFAQLGLTQRAEAAEAEPDKYYDYMETDMGVTDVLYTMIDPDCGVVKILFTLGGVDTFRINITDIYR